MWITLTLISAALFAVVNIFDKIIMTKWTKNPLVPMIVVGIINLLVAVFIFSFHDVPHFSISNILLSILVGFLGFSATILYYKALQIDEVSRVVPLFYIEPLYILILAAIFLGEIFSVTKYIGIFMLVSGAIAISLKNLKSISFGKSFWLMNVCVIMLSISVVLFKYLLGFGDFWSVFAYSRFGAVIVLIPVVYFGFNSLADTVKKHGKKSLAYMTAGQSLSVVAMFFSIAAVSVGYATLVSALGSVQPFFVLIISVLLSLFLPKVLSEEINKEVITQKVFAICLLVLGGLLVV